MLMLDDIMYKNNLLYPNFLWFLIKSGEIFLHNPERALGRKGKLFYVYRCLTVTIVSNLSDG